jgi:hypothetical protein
MTYSPEEIAAHKATVCDRIAHGESLRQICGDENMPAASTVFVWLAEDDAFSEQYARAREAQADALFDDILGIADDGTNDWMERKNADGQNIGWQENGEALRRSQLRIDARKWMAGKLKPKKYGDKAQMVVSGDADEPLHVVTRIERTIVRPNPINPDR